MAALDAAMTSFPLRPITLNTTLLYQNLLQTLLDTRHHSDARINQMALACRACWELSNLNLLKERVDKSSQLTKGMVVILSTFEHRLARLEETILPVYNETGNLQRRQESILDRLAVWRPNSDPETLFCFIIIFTSWYVRLQTDRQTDREFLLLALWLRRESFTGPGGRQRPTAALVHQVVFKTPTYPSASLPRASLATAKVELERKPRDPDIEKTLSALDHVIGFYSVSQEVEPVIRAGPGSVANSGAGFDTFLKALDKLQMAQEYFEKNNPQSATLFNSGGDALNREFKELLFRHSKPVPPISLLDLVGTDDDTPGEETSTSSLNHFPDAVTAELTRIAEWLIVHGRDEYMNVYARVRANVLLKSLQHLKEQQKTASGGSMQGVAAASSPMVRQKFQSRHETPSRRASKRLQHVFEKKANKMLLRASQTLEHSTGLTLGSRRSGLHQVGVYSNKRTNTPVKESREDVVDEQEMENYLVCVMALQRLMQSERSLMVGIIPLQHHHQVFEIVIREAMDLVVQDGEVGVGNWSILLEIFTRSLDYNIASRAKRCINRHDFAAVLVVFPILKHLLTMKPEFERTVEGCDFYVRSKFASILNTLHGTGSKALEEFVESVRSDPSTQLPKDGTVHELTSNVLVFLEQLLDYVDTIGGVLSQESLYSNALTLVPNASKVDKNKVLLGIYISECRCESISFSFESNTNFGSITSIEKVLVQLSSTLFSKSDLYNDMCLRAVFRLNNTHYVLKALQRSGLLDLVRLSEPECEEMYHQMIQDHKTAYCQSWSKILSHIWSGEDGPIALVFVGKLRDKDRNLIKERFAGFNKEMEEIAKVQRGYSIPDVELRECLKRDNKEYILPKYNAFYEKYSNIPFTKNPEKYIKYTSEQVSALIDRFFDVAA
uniref:Exocyst complex component 7 n=2 Tax=Timema TaxID=61471 RepID=A0A7R9IQA5_9NEOP|nr:unnamed protein product [Timema tahoe]